MTTSTGHSELGDAPDLLPPEAEADQPEDRAAAAATLSGVDLARVALHNARLVARRRGAEPSAKRKPRVARVSRDSGREPVGLAGALRGLLADHAWDTPVAGGGVLADWPRIAPELAGHVQAAGYDPETGTLELRPVSAAFGTHLRLNAALIINRINAHTSAATVRHLKVLGTGARVSAANGRGAGPGLPAVEAATVPLPHQRSAGYLRAVAACQAARPADTLAPAIHEAIERQTAAMAREPEEDFVPALEARLQLEAQQQGGEVYGQAVRRARQARVAQQPSRPSTEGAAAQVGRTA